MKLYIAIEKRVQKWVTNDVIRKGNGTTMAYHNLKTLKEVIGNDYADEYEIVEVEIGKK